jgi:hypothetical protein
MASRRSSSFDSSYDLTTQYDIRVVAAFTHGRGIDACVMQAAPGLMCQYPPSHLMVALTPKRHDHEGISEELDRAMTSA